MPQSIKLADEIMALARPEAERQSRSVSGQVAHWMRIGRAIERSGRFDHGRIAAALTASLRPEALTEEEGAVWLDGFASAMARPGEGEAAFYADRRALGRGVGLTEGGELVRATPAA